MVFSSVIAENSKDYQRHIVHQMVNDGKPLHARGQSDEMALGLVLVDELVAVVPQNIKRNAVQQVNLPTEHVGSLADGTLKDVTLQNGLHAALILLAVIERHMPFADRTIVDHWQDDIRLLLLSEALLPYKL